MSAVTEKYNKQAQFYAQFIREYNPQFFNTNRSDKEVIEEGKRITLDRAKQLSKKLARLKGAKK